MAESAGRIRFSTQEEIRGHAAGFISLGGFCPARRSMFGCAVLVPIGTSRGWAPTLRFFLVTCTLRLMLGFRFAAADTKQPLEPFDWINEKCPSGEPYQETSKLSALRDPFLCTVDRSSSDDISYSLAHPRQCQGMPDGLMGPEDSQ